MAGKPGREPDWKSYDHHEHIEHQHSIQPQFLYRHRWNEGDLLIWDNRSLMHFAVMDYPDDEPRYMERCTVIGEPPS